MAQERWRANLLGLGTALTCVLTHLNPYTYVQCALYPRQCASFKNKIKSTSPKTVSVVNNLSTLRVKSGNDTKLFYEDHRQTGSKKGRGDE